MFDRKLICAGDEDAAKVVAGNVFHDEKLAVAFLKMVADSR